MIPLSSARLVSLSELMNTIPSKNQLKKLLKTFTCPSNEDVERFLYQNAVKFEKTGLARTYIWLGKLEEKPKVLAYFTIALKAIHLDEKILRAIESLVSKEKLEEVLNDLLKGFPLGEQNKQIAVYLIGQVGKIPQVEKLKGYLVKVALAKIEEASKIVGGKIVILDIAEPEKSKKLLSLYRELGFKELYKYQHKGKEFLRLYRKLP
ncbi:hypothetical protein [Phorcysia thermohydrogeniphila]|uniref:N-acetyltransferase domain-containing protein n=1 Tax=Phorcysia thermohydrogeniphila TaxID=936138 RepID=A0A4V2PD06_9BACT|nr:hypothetical protein [Phorcysia thermohydrogeniphila]TCK03316.1 hypothetical protein CLV27_1387 [Phorcysia thermohydrogeniphila]